MNIIFKILILIFSRLTLVSKNPLKYFKIHNYHIFFLQFFRREQLFLFLSSLYCNKINVIIFSRNNENNREQVNNNLQTKFVLIMIYK